MGKPRVDWIVGILALALPTVALGNLCDDYVEYDLYAAQDILVGTINVCHLDDTLKVQFNTSSSGWLMTETHLAVAGSVTDIPQKNGNPIPGQFPFAEYHDPAVTVFDYYIDGSGLIGGSVFIAAHAKTWDPTSNYTMYVCSDGDESYTAYNNAALGPDSTATDGRTGVAAPAAEPWGEQSDSAASLWDLDVGFPFRSLTGSTGCADWIWEANYVDATDPSGATVSINLPVNPVNGDRVEFTESFTIPGPPLSGLIYVTADNAYEAYLNSTPPGAPLVSGQTGSTPLYPDWWMSDLREDSVNFGGWESPESAPLTGLAMGSNFLFFRAANEYRNADDGGFNFNPGDALISQVWRNPWIFVDSPINPGAIIWQAEIEYLSISESAWGDQYDFPGRNWATYIEYDWTE